MDDFLTALQNITPTGGLVREGTFLYFRDIQVGNFYKYLESSPEAFFFAVQNPNKKQVASVEETDSDAFPEHKWRTLPDPIIMPSFGEFCKVMYFIRVRWTNCQFPQILSMEFETHLQRIISNSLQIQHSFFKGWKRETKITARPKTVWIPISRVFGAAGWRHRFRRILCFDQCLAEEAVRGRSPEPTPKGWLPSSLVCSVVIR